MPMSNSVHIKSSTSETANFEKPSIGPRSFADFVMPLYATKSARGDVIALIKTLINARACPPIEGWRDLYRLLARRDASAETIIEARKLWAQFKSAVSPAKQRETG